MRNKNQKSSWRDDCLRPHCLMKLCSASHLFRLIGSLPQALSDGPAGLESLWVCARLRAACVWVRVGRQDVRVHRLLVRAGGGRPVILTYVVSEPPLLHLHVYSSSLLQQLSGCCLSTKKTKLSSTSHSFYLHLCTPFSRNAPFLVKKKEEWGVWLTHLNVCVSKWSRRAEEFFRQTRQNAQTDHLQSLSCCVSRTLLKYYC